MCGRRSLCGERGKVDIGGNYLALGAVRFDEIGFGAQRAHSERVGWAAMDRDGLRCRRGSNGCRSPPCPRPRPRTADTMSGDLHGAACGLAPVPAYATHGAASGASCIIAVSYRLPHLNTFGSPSAASMMCSAGAEGHWLMGGYPPFP